MTFSDFFFRYENNMSTQTVTTVVTVESPSADDGEHQESHHVTWAEGTVDNENCGKRKSKKCCIFKKRREFGESSSSEDDTDHASSCPLNKKE